MRLDGTLLLKVVDLRVIKLYTSIANTPIAGPTTNLRETTILEKNSITRLKIVSPSHLLLSLTLLTLQDLPRYAFSYSRRTPSTSVFV